MPNITSTNDEESHHRSWWDTAFQRITDILIPCCVCCPLSSLFDYPSTSTTVTGTIICPPNNRKVKMFMQSNDTEDSLCMVLEFPINTSDFAVIIRNENNWIGFSHQDRDSTWEMSYNGKGVGRALRKKEVTDKDAKLLEMIGSLTAGVGLLPDESGDGEHKYLRGQFERVEILDGSEAYHLVDPSGSFGQELSLFFYNY